MSVSQSSSVVFDGSGKPDGESNVDQSVGFGATRNTYSAHSNFSENTRTEKMVDGSGKPDERDSSNAQIRTLHEEQRQMIIAEYRDKVGHHELQAARAEEESRILRVELWRQQMDFREVHQQSRTEMEELRKFQSSTFDTLARRKLIEDQNTIVELSGRVQGLQNEVSCMNDSKDFQDAESVRSGNSHVTSRPVSFPPHPIPEGVLRHSFITPSRREGPPSIWDTHGISGNCLQIHLHLHQLRILLKNQFTCLQRRKVEDQNKIEILNASLDRQPKIQSSSVGETLQRIMVQTNNDCRFLISTLTSSLHQQPLLAGR